MHSDYEQSERLAKILHEAEQYTAPYDIALSIDAHTTELCVIARNPIQSSSSIAACAILGMDFIVVPRRKIGDSIGIGCDFGIWVVAADENYNCNEVLTYTPIDCRARQFVLYGHYVTNLRNQ